MVLFSPVACVKKTAMNHPFKEVQLTNDPSGHFINSTQAFSPDGQWIVYDSRNKDSGINEAGEIAMVNTTTGEIRSLYKTQGQTEHGPGLGAVTFSPTDNKVLFIHGIRNANKENPYSMTRRTGVSVSVDKPFEPVFFDARDMDAPFTEGALRGGTHAHTWSGDGQWISYTYNDYLIEQAEKKGGSKRDLRTIGVMIPGRPVKVPADPKQENNDGELYSVIVAEVTDHPKPGSDEIEKAFDECWIGQDGYIRPDGTRQRKAIAYQGNVKDADGNLKTEIFVVDLPDNLLEVVSGLKPNPDPAERLPVPKALVSRRITRLEKGVSGSPRHWLRSSADGSMIGFLAADSSGIIQLFVVSPNGGEVRQVTHHAFSIAGPINFSYKGHKVAYIADNSVFITDVDTGVSERITEPGTDESRPHGAAVWSPDDSMLTFNRYVTQEGGSYSQVFLLRR